MPLIKKHDKCTVGFQGSFFCFGAITSAIERILGPFRVADIQRECPGVSLDMIRQVLKIMKATGQVECLGLEQSAQWQRIRKGNR